MSVIALLALVSAIGATGLSAAAAASGLDGAVAAIEAADRSARLLAVREGSLRLARVDEGGATVIVNDQGTLIRRIEMPRGATVSFSSPANGSALEFVEFDARGRSEDYFVSTTVGGQLAALRIAGLTGWVAEVRSNSP